MKFDYWKYNYFFMEVEFLFGCNEVGYSCMLLITREQADHHITIFLFCLGESYQLGSC